MSSRALASSIGLGNDICHIPRIYKILTSKRGPRFIERVLTDLERKQQRPSTILRCVVSNATTNVGGTCEVHEHVRHHVQSDGTTRDPIFWKAAEFMAGRFAAKEAAIKAYHQQKLTFHDIEISNHAPSSLSRATFGDGGDDADGDAPESIPEPDGSSEAHTASPSSGPPQIIIRAGGGRTLQNAMLSISHDGDYATAVCLSLPTG
ncbi:hypothetical protein BJ170DRAFT_235020 [Xylariales sp. AK1849]|nr:hypothetical protein BJ170DRAFT_235020 [Xylariales sp. AK1849]